MDPKAQFDELMRTFTSESNELRKSAEVTFEQLCKTPETLVPLLCGSMTQSEDETVRSMCAVMFRKRVSKDLFQQLCPATQLAVKTTLIDAVRREQNASVRRKLADTTGEIGAMILENGEWPEILQFLFDAGKADSADLRESSMVIFSRLSFVVSEKLIPFLPSVCELFRGALQDPQSKDVRLAALNAAACMVQALSGNEDHLNPLQALIPPMLAVIGSALNEQDEESARSGLEDLISIAEEAPKFYRRCMDDLIGMCFTIVNAKQLEQETRFLAVELLITLAEQAPAMMRKQQLFATNIVPLALQLMLMVDEVDPAEWNSTIDDEDDMTSLDVGKDCLDRLALSIGGKTVFSQAFRPDLVPAFLEHPEWTYRHAALCCISQIAEGCKKQMSEHLEAIIRQIAARFTDDHARVRWAAINAMGQLETDLGPDMQNTFHMLVLPALIAVMDDVQNPRVQSHAAAAIINFTENCDKDILIPYLDALLSKLVGLLLSGQRIVQEQAITAIASVADCVENNFSQYYGRIMPTLKQMLLSCPTKEHRLLRGKTMECISLIGIAVGRDVFLPDAKEVMDQFLATQTATLDADDPQSSYLLQAWGRVAKALKQDFIPYLNVVMPPLLKAAEIKVDVQMKDLDDEDDNEEEEGISTVLLETDTGTKKVALKTSALEEKATACNMLVCYFAELQEGMCPWIDSVAKIMVPLISFVYHEEVRTAAAALMPELVKSAVLGAQKGLFDGAYVAQLCSFVFDKVITATVEDPEPSVQLALVESLHETCCNVGNGCLGSPEKVDQALNALCKVMEEVLGRTEDRAKARKDEDFDDDEAEALDEAAQNDEELLDGVCAALASVTKTHAEVVAQRFTASLPIMWKLIQSAVPSLRRIGLCALDDVLENLQEHGQGLVHELLPAMVTCSQDPAPEVRQAAVYGLGVCAQYGGAVFAAAAAEVVRRLMALIEHPQGRSEENVHATDNAVSALGKVLEYQADAPGVDREAAMTAFVGYLPMGEPIGDKEEGIQAHGRLCTLLERGDTVLVSNPSRWITPIVCIFGRVLKTKTVDEAVTLRIQALLRRSLPPLPLPHASALAQSFE